jgi:hypothetical protein
MGQHQRTTACLPDPVCITGNDIYQPFEPELDWSRFAVQVSGLMRLWSVLHHSAWLSTCRTHGWP